MEKASSIESGGNNLAVRGVGNCITARAHRKRRQCTGFSNSMIVQQLWKKRGGAVALATAWWWLWQQRGGCFGNCMAVLQLC